MLLFVPNCLCCFLLPQATVVLKSMGGSSIVCEHKLGGGRKRCSYTPGSTVQDWLLLQHTAARGSSAGGTSSSQQEPSSPATAVATGKHVPGVSQVSVRHDAAGFSGAWLLQCVIVQHLQSGEWWQFDNRSSWIKGSQQAKAVAARDEGSTPTAAVTVFEPANAASSAAPPSARQLQLSASGVAANCPSDPMPRSSAAGHSVPQPVQQTSRAAQQQQTQAQFALASSSSAQAATGSSPSGATAARVEKAAHATLAVINTSNARASVAAAAAVAAAGADDAASTASRGDSTVGAAGGFVPLDDVELKLRGSPRRSCSPSPTHKLRQPQEQQPSGQEAAAASSSLPAAAVFEVSSLRGIAAMVSRAAAPAAAATAAAWDVLGSRRNSVGELRHPASRRVSGSVAPAKIVPLAALRGSSSSGGGGGEEGIRSARESGTGSAAAAGSVDSPEDGSLGLSCRISRTLTHSSDGTPCRLVRCSSSYLGRTSSSNARQLQEQEQQRGVHFLEWAEQVEFDAAAMQTRNGAGSSGTSSSSSIQSFTEEQLLEAQGGWEFVRPPDTSSSYTTLIDSQLPAPAAVGASAGSARQAAVPAVVGAGKGSLSGAAGGSGELQEVQLVVTKPSSLLNKGGVGRYQLRIYTADKIGAALPAGQHLCVEVMGSTGAVLSTQLPR